VVSVNLNAYEVFVGREDNLGCSDFCEGEAERKTK